MDTSKKANPDLRKAIIEKKKAQGGYGCLDSINQGGSR
jgi:hypothetical protein